MRELVGVGRSAGVGRESEGTAVVVKRPNKDGDEARGGVARPVSLADLELVERARAGHVESFAKLVEKYQDRVFNTCWRICGNLEDARDLAQDAFLRAFERMGSFRHEAGFYTWLFRIAVNLALSHRRRQNVRAEVPLEPESFAASQAMRLRSGQAAPGEQEPANATWEHRERLRLVVEALRRLDEEHRAVLVLRDIEGMDYDEIGQVLELPKGTVKSRLHRARMALRVELGGGEVGRSDS